MSCAAKVTCQAHANFVSLSQPCERLFYQSQVNQMSFGRQRKKLKRNQPFALVFVTFSESYQEIPRILFWKKFLDLCGSSCSSVLSGGLFCARILYQHHSCEAPRILPAGNEGDAFGEAVFHHRQMRGLGNGDTSWHMAHPHPCVLYSSAQNLTRQKSEEVHLSWETAKKSISSFTARNGCRNSGVIRCSCSRLHPLTPTPPPRSTLCSAAARLPDTQTSPQPLSPGTAVRWKI